MIPKGYFIFNLIFFDYIDLIPQVSSRSSKIALDISLDHFGSIVIIPNVISFHIILEFFYHLEVLFIVIIFINIQFCFSTTPSISYLNSTEFISLEIQV
jgi:hypothetical protein